MLGANASTLLIGRICSDHECVDDRVLVPCVFQPFPKHIRLGQDEEFFADVVALASDCTGVQVVDIAVEILAINSLQIDFLLSGFPPVPFQRTDEVLGVGREDAPMEMVRLRAGLKIDANVAAARTVNRLVKCSGKRSMVGTDLLCLRGRINPSVRDWCNRVA